MGAHHDGRPATDGKKFTARAMRNISRAVRGNNGARPMTRISSGRVRPSGQMRRVAGYGRESSAKSVRASGRLSSDSTSSSIGAARAPNPLSCNSELNLPLTSSSESGFSALPRATAGCETSTSPSARISSTTAQRSAGKRLENRGSSTNSTRCASDKTASSRRPAPSISPAPSLPRLNSAATGKGRLYCACSVVAGARTASLLASRKVRTWIERTVSAATLWSRWSWAAASIAGCAQRHTG